MRRVGSIADLPAFIDGRYLWAGRKSRTKNARQVSDALYKQREERGDRWPDAEARSKEPTASRSGTSLPA